MMCCKSFGVLFLLLFTASSQEISDFGGLNSPFSSGESSQSSSASSGASTASRQSAGQNYGDSDTAFQDFASQSAPFASQSAPFASQSEPFASQSAPYGFQQGYSGEPGQFDNGFNNYGLQNQGSKYGFVNQGAGSSGFSQGYSNQPEDEIINPPPGLPDSTEQSSPQGGPSSPFQLGNAPLNFPEFQPNFPPDSIASTPQTAGGSEIFPGATPAITPSLPQVPPEEITELLPEGIGSPELTPDSGVPSPVVEPVLPVSSPVELPDVFIEPSILPFGNGVVAEGADLPDVPLDSSVLGNDVGEGDFPFSEFPDFPLTGNNPTLFDDNEGLFPGGYYDDGFYDDDDYYDDGFYDDGDYYDDEDYYDGYYDDDGDYDDDDGDYDDDDGDDDDDDGDDDDEDCHDLADDSNFQQPQPIGPPQLQPSQPNGNGFGGGILPWPICNQANFFPGIFRRCCIKCCRKKPSDVKRRCGCVNSRFRCCCC